MNERILCCQCNNSVLAHVLEAEQAAISMLARVSSVRLVTDAPTEPCANVVINDGLEAFLPIKV